MRSPASSLAFAPLAVALSIASVQPAFAACTRLGFSVNDYGKDGPTQDAKGLLDKYIAKWAADHGVKTYRTGTKEVKCELFLNLIVFDEHTCRAEATVCWDGAPVTPPVNQAAAPGDKPASGTPLKKVTAPVVKPIATATPKPAALETGTVSVVPKPVVAAPVTDKAPVAPPKPAAASADATVAQQALAAAQKAAEAAERAAAAAERAAASAAAGSAAKP